MAAVAMEWEVMVRDLRASRNASKIRYVHVTRKVRAIRRRQRQIRQGNYDEITSLPWLPVRIICLPPNLDKASDDDWSKAVRLSVSLAEYAQRFGSKGFAQTPTPRDDSDTR